MHNYLERPHYRIDRILMGNIRKRLAKIGYLINSGRWLLSDDMRRTGGVAPAREILAITTPTQPHNHVHSGAIADAVLGDRFSAEPLSFER